MANACKLIIHKHIGVRGQVESFPPTTVITVKLHFHPVWTCLYWPGATFPVAKTPKCSLPERVRVECCWAFSFSPGPPCLALWVQSSVPHLSIYLQDWVTSFYLIQFFSYHLQPGTPLCLYLRDELLLRQLSVGGSKNTNFFPTEGNFVAARDYTMKKKVPKDIKSLKKKTYITVSTVSPAKYKK